MMYSELLGIARTGKMRSAPSFHFIKIHFIVVVRTRVTEEL